MNLKQSILKQLHLNSYHLTGTFRKFDSVGAMQPFKLDSIEETPLLAMKQARKQMYDNGYDHILFQHVYLNGCEIPMMEALELE